MVVKNSSWVFILLNKLGFHGSVVTAASLLHFAFAHTSPQTPEEQGRGAAAVLRAETGGPSHPQISLGGSWVGGPAVVRVKYVGQG